MAFIVEDGSGIAQANCFASIAYALNYLTERNRQDENGWADLDLNVRQAHLIGGTDYLENRFRECFMGSKEFRSLTLAKAVLSFTANPIALAVVVIGSRTYTYVAALGVADDVLVGANASESMANLIQAITADPDFEGISYGTGTLIHPDATARAFEDDAMICEALLDGTPGNLIVTTTTVVSATWSSATLIGGTDTGRPQPLSFPRVNLFDRDGVRVVGIPDRLKQCNVEYSVRAAAAVLQPDPDITTGPQVIELKEKVDVIEEVTKWSEGGAVRISKPYPAADSLIREYLRPGGLVLR